MPIVVQINGEPREIPEGMSVEALLHWLGLTATRVAVELNASVVTRTRHATTTVSAGDTLEVVTFVGGG
jgi:sulfur carrier protein